MSKNTDPPPAYTPVPQQTTVVITQPTVVLQRFGPNSQVYVCPYCNHSISTRVEIHPSTKTHLIALCLCLFGFWFCCCCPYCIDSCQAKNHYCPQCCAYLGTYDN